MAKVKSYGTNHLALVAVAFTVFGLVLALTAVRRVQIAGSKAASQPVETIPGTAVGEAADALQRMQEVVDKLEKAQSYGALSSDVALLARQLVQEQKMVETKLKEAKAEGNEYQYIAEKYQQTLRRQEQVLQQLMNQVNTSSQVQAQTKDQIKTALQEANQYSEEGMVRARQMLEE